MSDLSRYVGDINSAKSSMNLGTSAFSSSRFADANSTVDNVLTAVRAGDTSALNNLGDSLDVVAQPSKDLYASFTDYEKDYYKSYIKLQELADVTGHQLSANERAANYLETLITSENSFYDRQIGTLDSQLNALLSINDNILSLSQATAAYNDAKSAVGKLSTATLPGFAVGTDYVPHDMPAIIHQGERITPAAYNRSDKTNAELLAEIKALREEVQAQGRATIKNTKATADIIDAWNIDGMPEVRV